MNKPVMQMAVAAVLAALGIVVAPAAESFGLPPTATDEAQLDKLVGQPVDIAPWAYGWRADLAVQETPEAYFIPRCLERMDKVYRTAFHEMPQQQLRSTFYEVPELLKPLRPPPQGQLQAGLLWTGRLEGYQVDLCWPAGVREIPPPEAVEVRVFPSPFGWFGWTVDEILSKPEVSADRRTWTYKHGSTAEIPVSGIKDGKYWYRSGSATEMVAVFDKNGRTQGVAKSAVPSIRVTSPKVGTWKRLDLEIEWGFQAGTEKSNVDGRLESYVAMVGPLSSLAGDKGTTVTGTHAWQSRAVGDARRGIAVPLLYAPGARPGLDSRVTVWTGTAGFTFRPCDLENGPILIPEHGVFITKVGGGKTARQFAAELAAKHLKGIRQMTREHREAASWEELMRKVRLSTCPAGTLLPSFPKVEDPPMQVQLPDPRWTDAWRAASFQLKGRHMWGGLAFEVGRVAREMDMVGLHDEADKIYAYFSKSPVRERPTAIIPTARGPWSGPRA